MTPESVLFLCNFDDQLSTENKTIEKLWSEQWSVRDQSICKELLATGLDTDALGELLKTYQRDSNVKENILYVSISSFLTFCDRNWNPHPEKLRLEECFGVDWPKDIDANILLQRDSEPIYLNVIYPELLYFSTQVFSALCNADQSLLHLWWYFRSKVAHQRSLEDTSATLYAEHEIIIAKLTNLLHVIQDKPRLQILLCIEIAQAYLIYGRVQRTEEYLTRARDLAGLKLELTGILGKRTKFQQTIIPQLALSSELDSSIERPTAEESHGTAELPPDLELQDDLRLSKIHYTESISQAELPSLEQILCLLTVQYLIKSQPKDELMNEELEPYIAAVLSPKKGAWPTRVAALLIRCKLEANHKRTVERAMLQCETIVNDKTGASSTTRLSYLWGTGLQPAWVWRQQLADLYLNLGLVKAALEEYLKLQLWEDVIVCYTALQLRHKAAEIIQQQIDINPTVKLYCLLGDATDDVKCYEKAWEFSNHKSSRAQRHWGNFLFDHKKYEECIPHFEKSVEINSIQDRVWLRLGYAALMVENWEVSAKAYRRYTYLQPNTFEAWNNLAKVYVNQGDKKRAYRALMEALRFNYDNWKVVPWLDGSSVKLCPNCAKTFNLTRRKHHCRLCGSILCHDCSLFLDINVARAIVDPSAPQTSNLPDHETSEKNGLRLCEHCYNLIELRKQVQESRNAKTVLVTAYEQMRSLMDKARPDVVMYEKMCQSLFDGETTYNLTDVNKMRGRIGKLAEGIDLLSKQIISFPAEPGTRQARLQTAIRQAAAHYIKEDLLSLRKLPTEAQIDEVRRQRYEKAERQIQMERERMERQRDRLEEMAGPSASRVESNQDDDDNPLLEQMNIIREYIKEARKEMKFEEVAILETNLKELKKEYQLQKLSNKS